MGKPDKDVLKSVIFVPNMGILLKESKIMENQENIKENEEISIIDLLAVLIKYRKLIIIGTVIPTVVAALWLFVAKPILKPVEITQPETKVETKVIYKIRINYMTESLYNAISKYTGGVWDIHGRLINDFTDPTVIIPLYEKNQFIDFNNIEELEDIKELTELEDYIKYFINNKLMTISPAIEASYIITINLPVQSLEKLEAFIKSYIKYEIDLIDEHLVGWRLDYLYEMCKRKITEVKNAAPNTVNYTEIQNIKDALESIENWKKLNKPYIEIAGDPIIDTKTTTITPPAPPKEPKVKELIIVAVASLFIFIFIAFLLNAIQNIKDDPVSSQKIKEAWKEGKK